MVLQRIKNSVLNNFLYRISIKRRLIFYFILSILIPTSIVCTTIYIKSTNTITKKIDLSIEKNLNTAEAIIVQRIDSAKDIATLILMNLNVKVINVLSSPKPVDTVAIVDEITTLEDILSNYSLSSVSDVTKATFIPHIYIVNRPEYNQYHISDKVFDFGLIENEKWVKEFTNRKFAFAGLGKVNSSSKRMDTLRFAQKVYNLRVANPNYVGILTIDIEAKYFNDILESFKASPGSSVYVVDSHNSILLSNDLSMSGKELTSLHVQTNEEGISYRSFITTINGKKMLTSIKSIKTLDWTIVAISPLDELNDELRSFRKVVYGVLGLSLVLSFLTALLLAADVAKPIQRLVKSMSTITEGNLEPNIIYKRNDEFAFLIQQYKRMVSEIKELIQKLYVSELNKQNAELKAKTAELKAKDSELKALQAQINPHFLYNTLDSINWMAVKRGDDEISTMVQGLADFFRYSLNKGCNTILWKDEIKQVESYLTIQKVRFRNKLDYNIEVPDEIAQCYTIKLILQPIVENAIIHGIEKKDVDEEGEGCIEIHGALMNGLVEISISDNGIGADTEVLNAILEDENNTLKSFGLRNVNLRIKQYFGNEYGLRFDTNQWGGVTVKIAVPAEPDKEKKYV